MQIDKGPLPERSPCRCAEQVPKSCLRRWNGGGKSQRVFSFFRISVWMGSRSWRGTSRLKRT